MYIVLILRRLLKDVTCCSGTWPDWTPPLSASDPEASHCCHVWIPARRCLAESSGTSSKVLDHADWQWIATEYQTGVHPLSGKYITFLHAKKLKKQWQAYTLVNSILKKITKIGATRCQILRVNCTKIDFGWGSAPDPAEGAYSAPSDPLAVFKGAYF